jgi:predicted transcriptional regulator
MVSILVIMAIATAIGGTAGAVYFQKEWTNLYKKSFNKLSDAELLQLFTKHGTLDSKKLTKISNLSRMEAYVRLLMLNNQGATKTVYDNYGYSAYVLKHEAHSPEIIPTKSLEVLNEEDMLLIAAKTKSEINAVNICLHSNLPYSEAKKELTKWKEKGLLKTLYSSDMMSKTYILNKNIPEHILLKAVSSSNVPAKIKHSNSSLSDADIISVAVSEKGKLTATMLCLRKNIPIEQAQQLLERLHEKQVFEIVISDKGVVEYHLMDESLLR